MSIRKTTFEVVPLADIAPLLIAHARGEAHEAGTKAATKGARILSVTYDPSLAATREMLFASVGFQVSSVLTAKEAMQLCATERFDLIVIGHSIPLSHKQLLVKMLRPHCDAPILALQRLGEPSLPDANYTFDSTLSPALLLETVTNILKLKTGTDPGRPA
jgi:PleD family two-component response regulator